MMKEVLSSVFIVYSPSLSLLPRRKIQTKMLRLQEEVCSARYCNSEYFLPVSVVKKVQSLVNCTDFKRTIFSIRGGNAGIPWPC